MVLPPGLSVSYNKLPQNLQKTQYTSSKVGLSLHIAVWRERGVNCNALDGAPSRPVSYTKLLPNPQKMQYTSSKVGISLSSVRVHWEGDVNCYKLDRVL